MREFIDTAVVAVIALAIYACGHYAGSIDGEATGRRSCPKQQGREVVAMTPGACMYASAYGREIRKGAR